MGILDDLLGAEKKVYREKPALLSSNLRETQSKMSVSIRFHPLRLAAKRDNRIDMIVRITNESTDKQLLSFEAFAPANEMIGFDSTLLNKHYEKKLGYLEPKANVEFAAVIYGSSQTKAGSYGIDTNVYAHYIDYHKVIHYLKRKVLLRVV